MRRPFGCLALLAVATFLPAGRSSAQVLGGVGTDPFSFYYGYYLPHQAMVAAQPTPLDTINQLTAVRGYQAQTDRAALYDPISPYGGEEDDPFRPGGRRGGERIARVQSFGVGGMGGPDQSNTRGTGPSAYYNRTARYFPSLRVGRGPNRNLAAARPGRGGMGMPATPNPNPGPSFGR
jgi:hypothetical protein